MSLVATCSLPMAVLKNMFENWTLSSQYVYGISGLIYIYPGVLSGQIHKTYARLTTDRYV